MKASTYCLAILLFGANSLSYGSSTSILDQSNTSHSSGQFLGSGTGISAIAQTFVPGLSGQFTSVNLLLNTSGSPSESLYTSIYDTENGLPRYLLGTAVINNIGGNFFAWYSADFSSQSIFLNENNTYALVFTHPDPIGGFIYVRGSVGDGYPFGMALIQTETDPAWQPDTRSPDALFQTFMQIPEPSIGMLIFSGFFCLVLMGKARRVIVCCSN